MLTAALPAMPAFARRLPRPVNHHGSRVSGKRLGMLHAQRHLLVVDDDPTARATIGDYLGENAFRVSTASDGAAMKRILRARPVDLIVLNLELGREDGLGLIKGVAEREDAPIIGITRARSGDPNRIVALELGADDCISAPVNLRELLARVRAVLRRARTARADASGERARWRFAGWELDSRRRALTSPSGEPVRLTTAEFNLLTALLRAPNRVLSRHQLVQASRVTQDEISDRAIDVTIMRLRRKLVTGQGGAMIIRTTRGVGYSLAAPVEALW